MASSLPRNLLTTVASESLPRIPNPYQGQNPNRNPKAPSHRISRGVPTLQNGKDPSPQSEVKGSARTRERATSLTRMEAIATAQQMHTGGWTIEEIRKYISQRGIKPSWATVKSWVDAEYAERLRASGRERQRRNWRKQHGTRPHAYKVLTEHEKFARLTDLREAGLSHEAVAKVLRLDFGDDLSHYQVRRAIQEGRYPQQQRRKART